MQMNDTTELRSARIRAYRANAYVMSVPPVCTTLWDEEAWINWVKFNDTTLTGFLPYDAMKQKLARSSL